MQTIERQEYFKRRENLWTGEIIANKKRLPETRKALHQIQSGYFPFPRCETLRGREDGLNRLLLSDLGFWRNNVSVKYYVYDIPANYLIDPNGTIIAKNINGDELLFTLKKLIK